MTDKKKAKPWETLPSVWKSEAAFMSYIRGGVRGSLWKRYPIKTEFMKSVRTRQINPKTGKECFGATCYLCGEWFPQAQIEIDHLVGGHSLKTVDDASKFIEGLLYVDFDDLSTVCKGCHKSKSYAEKQGISFEEAVCTKRVIEMEKNKTLTKWIEDNGQVPASNAKGRRQQAIEMMHEKG